MSKPKKEKKKVIVKLTLTEGYERRFTEAMLAVYDRRQKNSKNEMITHINT